MTERRKRTDALGRAFAGSQLQIQIYLNRRPEELSQRLANVLPSLPPHAHLRWASPLEGERFVEYQDMAFLSVVGFNDAKRALKTFWPLGGPSWDALAVVEVGRASQEGILLVEAKSRPSEMYSVGCRASPASYRKIETALNQTKRWLGVSEQLNWTGSLYQSANRLAHLYFFREVVRIQAWLANVYFLNDPHSPTSMEAWGVAIAKVKAALGLTGIDVPYTAEVFLEAKTRRELTSPVKTKLHETLRSLHPGFH